MNSFKEKGVPAPKDNFTGTVWVNMNIKPEDDFNTLIGTVTFEPKGRTNWHTHTCGQILFVTQGIGYYQEKGKPIQVIREGDVVKIPKNTIHWHGASHNSAMIHIAIVPELDKDTTQWLQPVAYEEYNSYHTSDQKRAKEVKLTEAAVKNHEELWPNYTSKARETGPELIEVFDNFAFDGVIRYGNLNTKTREFLTYSMLISMGGTEFQVEGHIQGNMNVGNTKETLLSVTTQLLPYTGYPRALNAIKCLNEVIPE